MTDPRAKNLADKLLASGFARTGPDASVLTDPIADTPMVVTLDQLRPYDLNPRITRNPRYDDLKASIHERGLDAPPPITRRPGDAHFMIRNGGNTRLAILRELWSETKDEKFFRITCLFRPWSARGEIVALTGHLAENELHGALSFIERALGIAKARELYEQEIDKPLSQRELARRLTADGYPVAQSLITRMQEAVQYLLPAIPSVLYAGLGRPQVERLIALRKAAARCWERHSSTQPASMDFPTLFQDVLALFETDPQMFHVQRVQDELLGKLSNALNVPYGTLTLEIVNEAIQQGSWIHESTQRPLPESNAPVPEFKAVEPPASTTTPTRAVTNPTPRSDASTTRAASTAVRTFPEPQRANDNAHSAPSNRDVAPLRPGSGGQLRTHVASPAETSERLQAVPRTIAQDTAESLPEFETDVERGVPMRAGDLYSVSDFWDIEAALDVPERLRTHIAQLATEIAQEATLADRIECTSHGMGFVCASTAAHDKASPPSSFQRAVLSLLHSVSAPYTGQQRSAMDDVRGFDDLAVLLQGSPPSRHATPLADRLSDTGFVKYCRLSRLARRLLELEWSAFEPESGPGR